MLLSVFSQIYVINPSFLSVDVNSKGSFEIWDVLLFLIRENKILGRTIYSLYLFSGMKMGKFFYEYKNLIVQLLLL